VGVFDAVVEAGSDLGLRLAGMQALDSLRLEVGYRHLGHDLTAAENPGLAGLDRFVADQKPGGFVGREALAGADPTAVARRQGFLLLDDPLAVLHGGDTVRSAGGAPGSSSGEVVGLVTSAAHGHSLGADCGIVILDHAFAATVPASGTAAVQVDVLFGGGSGRVSWTPFRLPRG